MLTDRVDLDTPKLCKSRWITNYILKCRAEFKVSDFSPGQIYIFIILSSNKIYDNSNIILNMHISGYGHTQLHQLLAKLSREDQFPEMTA